MPKTAFSRRAGSKTIKKTGKKVKTADLSIEVTMEYRKETPGTYVYADDSEDAVVPTQYIKKVAFNGGEPPKSITVTITSG